MGRHARALGALNTALERLAVNAARWSASSLGFAFAAGVVLAWLLLGPWLHYSESWQLVINTGTTIVTFLMVFLIQRTQNKDALAIHIKLNELVAAVKGASNRVVDIEALSEGDLQTLECHYEELARLAREDADPTQSHSVEDARSRHTAKRRTPDRS